MIMCEVLCWTVDSMDHWFLHTEPQLQAPCFGLKCWKYMKFVIYMCWICGLKMLNVEKQLNKATGRNRRIALDWRSALASRQAARFRFPLPAEAASLSVLHFLSEDWTRLRVHRFSPALHFHFTGRKHFTHFSLLDSPVFTLLLLVFGLIIFLIARLSFTSCSRPTAFRVQASFSVIVVSRSGSPVTATACQRLLCICKLLWNPPPPQLLFIQFPLPAFCMNPAVLSSHKPVHSHGRT